MRRWALLFGSFLVFIGLLSLVEAIWKIDLGKFFWPVILITIGVWILVRPPIPRWWNWDSRFVNFTTRTGGQYSKSETINGFVGDTKLDFTQMILPEGESRYEMNGFIGDITVLTNDSVGVKVRTNSFVGNVKIFGEESTGVMAPVEDQTKNYESAQKKVVIEANYFVVEIKVKTA